ncbi:LuxR C-terminal-related transcriptional regulator [Streptomyces sp. NPDC002776]
MIVLTDKTLAQLRNAGLVRPRSAQPGQEWKPRTDAEVHLLREAYRLDRARQILLEEVGRLRQQAALPRRTDVVAAAARAAERLKECPLSPAQLNVVAAAAAGESVHNMARRLGLSFETVSSHYRRALKRLDAQDMDHAVRLCQASGWIPAVQPEQGSTP